MSKETKTFLFPLSRFPPKWNKSSKGSFSYCLSVLQMLLLDIQLLDTLYNNLIVDHRNH